MTREHCGEGTPSCWGPRASGLLPRDPALAGMVLAGWASPPHQPPPLPEWREETKATCAKQAHSDEWAAESAH